MLVRKEKQFGSLREAPLKCASGIRGCADYALALPTKRFDRGRGVHVCNRRHAVPLVSRNARANQVLPAIFDLSNFRHVCHRASGVQVGKDRNLAASRDNISAFSHEMHTAKDKAVAASSPSLLRKFV